MKIMNFLILALITLFIASCSRVADPVKKIGLGSRSVNYQADESVDSLVIPPDLTSPRSQGAFTEVIKDDEEVLKKINNIEVKRDNYRRWLLVSISPNEVWNLSKDFLRSYGFSIEKENKKIGLMETNFLEIETKVPDKSLGLIRATLSKALQTQYGLPIADKYRIRIEPTDNPTESEIYLTLSSIGEVVTESQRLWQPREKDVELETEMLLKLMVFIGSENSEAIDKIKDGVSKESEKPTLELDEKSYAALVFPNDKKKTWSLLGWALDELSIDIDDRDQFYGTYFINVIPEKGFMSKLFSIDSNSRTYQLVLLEQGEFTKVIFVDISEEHDEKTISYSQELFNQIASKF
jgi:outer membrane protein assembly factor BamC